MNATKQIKQKTTDTSSPGTRKKGGKHSGYEANPMVLMPAAPKETITQYSLSLTSGNKDRMFDEMDMLRNITKHLNEIVHTMEGVYVKEGEVKEIKEEEEEEEEELSEDYEDMTSFLICCSQLRTQLENALREEKQILESLLKWFEKEVHEMEEIGEEEIIPDWQIPLADKSITNNINQLLNRIQRLEELKGRVQELPKLIQFSIPKQEKKKAVSPTPPTSKDPKNIIEELATRHLTEDVMNMVEVFQEDTGQPQTVEMMNNRMIEIMKVFERQTNKLHRVANEQDVLEGKLQKIQKEFQKLTEEKEIMEDELQKMKASEEYQDKGKSETRKKVLPKLEKVKIEEKPQGPSEKTQVTQKLEPGFAKEKESQMKEDLSKAQEDIQSLQEEKKMLEEKLEKALQEVEKAKIQLAEIPPTIPDWQYPLSAGVEEVPKKGKKASKGKTSETLSRKSQELSKQKGAAGVTEKPLKQASQPEDTDKKKEDSKKIKTEVVDKDVEKSKDSSEMKKRRLKGAGKDVSIEEKQQLPDSANDEEKILPVILDKHVEMLPPDSKILREEITISSQEHVPSTKQKTLQVTPEFKMKDPAEVKPLTLQKEIPRLDIDSVGLKKEEESHHLISKSMLQLKDHLTKLKGMPEAETLAKLLLESGKEKLPERQKLELLQMLNQLVTVDEMQQAGEREEDEKKRTLLANIVSVVRPLLQEQPPKADLSEKERNDLAEERTVFLSILDSHINDYQQVRKLENIETEIRKLSEERTQLRANVELNMKDLELARALASSQPSEINENRVKELEKQGALLVDNLEENQRELESARFLEEKKIDKLAKQSLSLLAILKSNVKELEEAEALAATQPSIIADLKIKELTELRNEVAEHLEQNLQNIQRAWSHAPGLTIESRLEEKELEELHELSELKQQLLESLESNQKELQEIQELVATQTCSVDEHMLQELTEQRRHLTLDLEATLDGIQDICHRPAERTSFIQPSEKELYDLHKLSEKKGQLLETLESNWRELEEIQELAAIQPSDITAHKLQDLTEQRKQMTTELEATLDGIQNICHQTSETYTFIPPSEKELHELYELSEKKQQLLEALQSNQKELHEIHELEAIQLDSINEHKLQELIEQKRFLTTDLDATLDNIQNVCRHSSERIMFIQPSEKELHELNELSDKKHQLLKSLQSNQKELQEIHECAPIKPDSVSEHKLQELNEERRNLTLELEATLNDMQNVCRHASEKITFIQPTGKELHELHELSEKKHQLLETLGSNRKELQEIQELVATQPGSVSEHKLQELAKQKIHLTSDLEEAVLDIQNICRHASERTTFVQSTEKELHKLQELTKKKQQLLETLESNWIELQEIQKAAATEPDSINEVKLQELTEQRRHLATDLEATLDDMQNVCRHYSETPTFIQPSEKELHKLQELTKKKQQLLETLESNWIELQEIQKAAATEPDSINEVKLQELTEQRRHLATDLEATLDDMQNVCRHYSETPTFIQPSERELYELLMKEQQLLEKMESNEKELQDAKALATIQPGSISDYKLQELTKQRRSLITNLEAIKHEIQKEFTSEGVSVVHPDERELYELSGKRGEILAKLESVQEELDETSASAAAHPGSVSEHALYKLSEEKRHLIEELGQTTINLLKAKSVASEKGIIGKSIENELYDLLLKKKELQEKLQSNEKEIMEAQILASIHPGIINEHALQELVEAKRRLTTDLKATAHDIQKAKYALEMAQIEQPSEIIRKERSLNHLLKKKELLEKRLDSNWTELEDAKALVAAKAGYVNEHKLQVLSDERSNLSKELKNVFQEILALQQGASEKFPDRHYGEKELYTLSKKKQLLLENLKRLQTAQALAAAQPGILDEDKQKQLTEQRKHLTTELEAIVKNIQRVEHSTSEILLDIRASEKDLHELLEKKFEILEDLAFNQKELQEVQVLATVQADHTSDYKLQDLTTKNRYLTDYLEATLQNIQEIPKSSSETIIVTRPSEEELCALLEKKEQLLENLQSKDKELKEAETLEINEPGTVSAQELQELNEQRRHLSVELEATIHDIQKIEDHASEQALMRRSQEIKLHKLHAWKKLLLEHLESNLELQEEIQAMEPDNTTEKKIDELYKQRKVLTENLEAVVEDINDMKSYISQTGGTIKYVEKDLGTLYQKKQMFLERLEINLNNLEEVQTVEVTHPSSINEQKIIDFTNERKLLVAGLEAVIQDLEDMQDITQEKVKKSKKQFLEELCEQKGFLLEKLSSNLKDLKQAQALAAAQPDSINEQNIQELNEQRRLLSVDLEGIVENIQHIQNLKSSKTELLTPGEIQALSEKRRMQLDNMELNLKDLKVLQAAAVTQPDNEQIIQQLAEKKIILFDNLEGIIQDVEQAQNFDLEKGLTKRSDEREIHELLVFSALESKCYELEEMETLSYNQMDVIKRKVHKLKEKRKSSFDRHHLLYPKEYPVENMLERQKEALKEFLQQRKHLFSYLRSSIESLQQKNIGWQEISDENIAKQRYLAAKLEANMKDIQAAFEKTQKIEKSRDVESRQQLQPLVSQKMAKVSSLHIRKAPVIKSMRHEETSIDSTKSEERPTSSLLEQRSKILSREDMSSRSKLSPQSLHKISSLFPFDISKFSADTALHELLEYNRTLLPGHRANLHYAWQLAQRKILQEQANLAEKFRGLSMFLPQPSGTTRFQDYSAQPSRPAWEANQLSQKGYPQKLAFLKRRLLGPDIRNNIKGVSYSSAFQGLTSLTTQVPDLDSFVICGKGCHPPRKDGTSPVIWQNPRSQ